MRPKDRPVIVLSTGRAGSTLLQKLLNTHPALVIWGEHAGILNQLMRAWRVVSQSEWIPDQESRGKWLLQSNRPVNASRWTAWDGSFSKQRFRRNMKFFIDGLFCENIPEHIRWGFKEIRYCQIELMDFLYELYPKVQFILLVRNPIDSCISFTTGLSPKADAGPNDFHRVMDNIVDKQIKTVFRFFSKAMDRYPENASIVLFEHLVKDPFKTLQGIVEFLDLSSGFDRDAVTEIMRHDIVSERKRISEEQRAVLREMALPLLKNELAWYERIAWAVELQIQS